MSTWSGRRAVGYIRFSKDEQSASLEQQRGVITRWASENGVAVVDWFIDDGISGTLREDRRTDFGRLLEAISAMKDFDLVLCYDLSRLGRFQRQGLYGHYFTLANDAGKSFYFIQDRVGSDDQEMERVIVRVLKEVGAGEKSRETARGAIRSQVERARRGRIVAGIPPFGFDAGIVDQKGQLIRIHRLIRLGRQGRGTSVWHVLNPKHDFLHETNGPPGKPPYCEVVLVPGLPERLDAVKLVFDWSADQGWGAKRIAGALNRMGLATYTGKKWGHSTILVMLRNPAYCGVSTFNRLTSAKVFKIKNRPDKEGNDHTRVEPKDSERGKTRKNGQEDWIQSPGAHVALVTSEKFDAVQRRLAEAARTRGGRGTPHEGGMLRTSRTPTLLAGLIRCGVCGHNYQGKSIAKRVRDPQSGRVGIGKEYKYYVCGAYLGGSEAACPKYYFSRERLEGPVLDRIRTLLLNSADEATWRAVLRKALEGQSAPEGDVSRRAGLEKRRNTVLGRIRAIATGISPENQALCDEALTELRQEREEIDGEIASIGPAKSRTFDVEAAIEELWLAIRDIRESFETAIPEERRTVVRRFVRQIVVSPKTKMAEVEYYKAPLGWGGVRLAKGWYPHGDLNPGPETENLGPAVGIVAGNSRDGKGKPKKPPAASGTPAPRSAPADPDLARLLAVWPDLPDSVRTSLLALAEAAKRGSSGGQRE